MADALSFAHALLVERRDAILANAAAFALAGVKDVNPDSLDEVQEAFAETDPVQAKRDRQAQIEAFLAMST